MCLLHAGCVTCLPSSPSAQPFRAASAAVEDALPQCKSPLSVPVALPGDAGLGCPPTTTQLSWSWLGFYWRPGGSCLPGFHVQGAWGLSLCCPSGDSVLPVSSCMGLSGFSHHATVPQAFLRPAWLWTKTGSQVLSGGGEGTVWVPKGPGSSVWHQPSCWVAAGRWIWSSGSWPLGRAGWEFFRSGMLGLKTLHSSDLTYSETAHGFIKHDVDMTWSELSGRIY